LFSINIAFSFTASINSLTFSLSHFAIHSICFKIAELYVSFQISLFQSFETQYTSTFVVISLIESIERLNQYVHKLFFSDSEYISFQLHSITSQLSISYILYGIFQLKTVGKYEAIFAGDDVSNLTFQ
jgi:hypothetical protein